MSNDHNTIKQYRALMGEVQHIVVTLRNIYRQINENHGELSPGVQESALTVASNFITALTEKINAGDALLNELSVKVPELPPHLVKQPSANRTLREAIRVRNVV